MPDRKYQSFCIKKSYQARLKKVSKKVSEPIYQLVEQALDNFLEHFEDNPPDVERHTKLKFEQLINDLQDIADENKKLRRENELYKKSNGKSIDYPKTGINVNDTD